MRNIERSKNRQLAINIGATAISFAVNVGINFFLTPYIVGSLGAAAYGFVSLSANIIGYTQLLTIALNSMAGRFVTIAYQQGRIDDANKYFSSVFYSNLVLAAIIIMSMTGCVLYLEHIFEIPSELIFDVKLLFSFLVINTLIGLLTNIYAVATFIKNRLELASLRGIISNIVRALVLLFLFGLLMPKLWYMGLAGTLSTIYIAFTNYRYTRVLTPELHVRKSFFDYKKVKELIISGSWNIISKLHEMLGQGLDLVVANLFIGATAMGFFSISKLVPTFMYSFFSQISQVFAPNLTKLYAEKKYEEMKAVILQSIRIMGFIATMPTVCLYSFGEEFYSLWMPTQNAHQLYILTILGTFASIFSMPLDGLWNIFTITNKIKYTSLFLLFQQTTSFVLIIVALPFVDGVFNKLCVFSVIRLILYFGKNLFFLPMFGAKCLNFDRWTFYPAMFKSVSCFTLSLIVCYSFHMIIDASTWCRLVIALILSACVCMFINSMIILTRSDRHMLLSKVGRIFSRK